LSKICHRDPPEADRDDSKIMPITSLTSYFNTTSFGNTNSYTRNQEELALTLDSAAHELSNWKSLLSMSAGGGGFEVGKLAATTFLSSMPALCAVPFLTNVFTFVAGAIADTRLTRLINQAFDNTGEEESFLDQITSQGSVRLMGLVGMGQSFAVIQLLQGLASVSREAICSRGDRPVAPTSFLHHLLLGLQCHFGSGMFAGLTGRVVGAVEQRISLRTKNVDVGARRRWDSKLGRVHARGGHRTAPPLLVGLGINEGQISIEDRFQGPLPPSKACEASGRGASGTSLILLGDSLILPLEIAPERFAALKRNGFMGTPADLEAIQSWLLRAVSLNFATHNTYWEMWALFNGLHHFSGKPSSVGLEMKSGDPQSLLEYLKPLFEKAEAAEEHVVAVGFISLLQVAMPEAGQDLFLKMAGSSSPAVRTFAYQALGRQASRVVGLWLDNADQHALARRDLNSTDPLRRRYVLDQMRIVYQAFSETPGYFDTPQAAKKYFLLLKKLSDSLTQDPSTPWDAGWVEILIDRDAGRRRADKILEMRMTVRAAHRITVENLYDPFRAGKNWNAQQVEAFLMLRALTEMTNYDIARSSAIYVEKIVQERETSLRRFVEGDGFNRGAVAQLLNDAIYFENGPLIRACITFAFSMSITLDSTMSKLAPLQISLRIFPHPRVQKWVDRTQAWLAAHPGFEGQTRLLRQGPVDIFDRRFRNHRCEKDLWKGTEPTGADLESLEHLMLQGSRQGDLLSRAFLYTASLRFLASSAEIRGRADEVILEVLESKGNVVRDIPPFPGIPRTQEELYRVINACLDLDDCALAAAYQLCYLEDFFAEAVYGKSFMVNQVNAALLPFIIGETFMLGHPHPAIRYASYAYLVRGFLRRDSKELSQVQRTLSVELQKLWREESSHWVEEDLQSTDPLRRRYANRIIQLGIELGISEARDLQSRYLLSLLSQR